MTTDSDETCRFRRRWREGRWLHSNCLARKSVSLRSAFHRMPSFHVSEDSYVIAITSVFPAEGPRSQLERRLRRFYNTFGGSEDRLVDWRSLVCTHLVFRLQETAVDSPLRLLLHFFDVFSDGANEGVSRNHISRLLSVAQLCDEKNDPGDILFTHMTTRQLVTREEFSAALHAAPDILLHFQKQILSKIPSENRLALLAAKEEQSALAFDAYNRAFRLRRAVVLWNNPAIKTFRAWARYTHIKVYQQRLALRMMCWKAKRAICAWKYTTKEAFSWKGLWIMAAEHCSERRRRKCFSLWRRDVAIQKIIRTACHQYSKQVKTASLGLAALSFTWYKISLEKMFFTWRNETSMQKKWKLSECWNTTQTLQSYFLTWTDLLVKKRIAARQETDALARQARLHKVLSDLDAEMKGPHVAQEGGSCQSPVHLNNEPLAITLHKNLAYKSKCAELIALQRHSRRLRVEAERNSLIQGWERKWAVECDKEIKECNLFSKSPEFKEIVTTRFNHLKLEGSMPLPIKNSSRDIALTSAASRFLAILDGNLGAAGAVSETFFERLAELSANGYVAIVNFEAAIRSFSITLQLSNLHDLFQEMNTSNEIEAFVKISDVANRMGETYIFNGIEGSTWKRYVSPAHQTVVFHDVVANKKYFEQGLTAKRLKLIAHDDAVASEILKVRKQIIRSRKYDLKLLLENHAAKSIQILYHRRQARKFIAHLRLQKTSQNID